MKTPCLVLLAHGSRNPRWRKPFEHLLEELRREVGRDRAYLSYMEMAEPSLSDVIRQLSDRGMGPIRILPLFMSNGSHLSEDIPAQVAQLHRDYPGLELELLPPIGSHSRFMAMVRELASDILHEAQSHRDGAPSKSRNES